jgi:hypothetical protein
MAWNKLPPFLKRKSEKRVGLGGLSLDSWFIRGWIYPYGSICILTLKRIYAEGLLYPLLTYLKRLGPDRKIPLQLVVPGTGIEPVWY